MRGWLVDTNVLSELRKPKPETNVTTFLSNQPGHLLHISAVTFAEIRFGIERLVDARRRLELTRWLDHEVRPLFAGRILDVDEDALLVWRHIMERMRKAGRTPSQPDTLIAAMSSVSRTVVVSRDTSSFEDAGVRVFDPWKGVFTDESGQRYDLRNVPSPELAAIALAR